jgi:hypothetical protein
VTDARCEELLRISSKQFDLFRPWRNLNQEIADNVYPIRADWTRALAMEEFAGNLMDDTPVMMRETLGNAINAMLRQGRWFGIGTGDTSRDDRPANKVSLNVITNKLYGILGHPWGGYADAFLEWDHDWVSFGTLCGSIETSPDRNYLVAKAWHPAHCAWMQNEQGRVDTFFRDLKLTARDIMRRVNAGRWTGEVSPEIRQAERLEPMKEFKIRHILMPADDIYGKGERDTRRVQHPFLSIYIDVDNHTYLNEAGAPVFNYVVGRQRRLSGKPWGFSPMALNSLNNARMLQDMALVILEQGQKSVDPPTIGAGSVFTRDMNFFSGGHTEVDLEEDRSLKDVFATIETGRIDTGLQLKADVRQLIAEAWLYNKLNLPSLRDMRELEVQVRTDEFRRAVLPFFQPIESNYHDEVLGTTFAMAMASRLISWDMFSNELRGHDYAFTFESPLNEAEGLDIVRKYYEAINIVAAGSKVDQTVATIFDLRGAAEEAIARGTKPEWLIPEDQREQADQNATALNGLSQAATIAQTGAGVAADMANAKLALNQAAQLPQAA